jgi:hypothetical protein
LTTPRIYAAIDFVRQRQHNQNSSGDKMAKITQARRKEANAGTALDARIRTSIEKATREVCRHGDVNKIKLAAAAEKSWGVSE